MISTLSTLFNEWFHPFLKIIEFVLGIIFFIILLWKRLLIKWIACFAVLSIGSTILSLLFGINFISEHEQLWILGVFIISFLLACLMKYLDTPESRRMVEREKMINNMVEEEAGLYCKNCYYFYYGSSRIDQWCFYNEKYPDDSISEWTRACTHFRIIKEEWDKAYKKLYREGAFDNI